MLGEAESPLRKWHYPGKCKKFPAPLPLSLLVTTHPNEEATPGDKKSQQGCPLAIWGLAILFFFKLDLDFAVICRHLQFRSA